MVDRKTGSAALLVIGVVAALAAGGVPSIRADWIVTRQGARIETRGPWQEKGKLVVFALPDGKLSSLRLADVDLAASQAATREAKAAKDQPPKEPVKVKKASVAVLTDKDFQHPPAAAEPADAEKKDKEEKAGGGDKDKKASPVVVAGWERGKAPGDGHLVITGTVRNTGTDQATAIGVSVWLFDEAGTLIGKGEAVLTSTVLPAGGTGGFTADFPGVFAFAAAKLDVRSHGLATKPGAPPGVPSSNGEAQFQPSQGQR